jgi:phage-related baseplate assembly protein
MMEGFVIDVRELPEPTTKSKALANEIALALLDFMVEALQKVDKMHSRKDLEAENSDAILTRALIEAEYWQGEFKVSMMDALKMIIVLYDLDRSAILERVETILARG